MAKKHDKKHKTAKPAAKTTLYRLIEAGHLARQRLIVPLRENGLHPGDDALLFSLTDPKGVSEKKLRTLTGLDATALSIRLARLEQMQILERLAVGPHLTNGARLTVHGHAVSARLQAHWNQLEEALIGELHKTEHQTFSKNLKRFVKLLRL